MTIVDDFSSGKESNLAVLKGDVELIRGDFADPDVQERACRGITGIFHQAAVASVKQSVDDPLRCDRVNVHGTVRLLETARKNGVQRFVFAASAAAYGDSEELPKREAMRPEPLSPYAVSKVAGEHYLRVYAQLFGMKTFALRYFNVFGPRQDPSSEYAAVVPKFIEALLEGRQPTVNGDGEQTRDFCYIENVVDANMRAIELENAAGQVVNIAGGKSISLLELLERMGKALGVEVKPKHGPPRVGDIRHSAADITAAREVLGYAPKVSVDEGIARTVDWYRNARG